MVNPGVQLTLRSIVAFSALFTGGSIVHRICAPDLTIPTTAQSEGAGFVPATAFGGARSGFAYKTGSEGLGYYPDKKR